MEYYSVSGSDNNTEFYYKKNSEILKYCEHCGLITNRDEAITFSIDTFKMKKKGYNLSSCCDGPEIVSEKFVELFESNGLKGLNFVRLPKSPGFYLVQYNHILQYDYTYNPNLYLLDKCPVCNQWKEVSIVHPIKITDNDEKTMKVDTFYRTDLEYGEKVRRSPLLLATANIPEIFKTEKMRDVYFKAAGKK